MFNDMAKDKPGMKYILDLSDHSLVPVYAF